MYFTSFIRLLEAVQFIIITYYDWLYTYHEVRMYIQYTYMDFSNNFTTL